MVAAYLILAFLGVWNNFVGPQHILQSTERQTLAVAMNMLKGVHDIYYRLVVAGTLCSIAPIMRLFLLPQKDFISGLTSGAVKG